MSRRAPSVARPSDSHSSPQAAPARASSHGEDRKSTRLNSSHGYISYAVFCLKKKKRGRLVRNSDQQSAGIARLLPLPEQPVDRRRRSVADYESVPQVRCSVEECVEPNIVQQIEGNDDERSRIHERGL